MILWFAAGCYFPILHWWKTEEQPRVKRFDYFYYWMANGEFCLSIDVGILKGQKLWWCHYYPSITARILAFIVNSHLYCNRKANVLCSIFLFRLFDCDNSRSVTVASFRKKKINESFYIFRFGSRWVSFKDSPNSSSTPLNRCWVCVPFRFVTFIFLKEVNFLFLRLQSRYELYHSISFWQCCLGLLLEFESIFVSKKLVGL